MLALTCRVLCRLGFHFRCPQGLGPPGTANHCPYWGGWHDGYAWAVTRGRNSEGG